MQNKYSIGGYAPGSPISPEQELIYKIVEQWGNVINMPKMEGWLKEYAVKHGEANNDAHEKEIMMQAFDKVRQLFEGRQWIMDGRGSYPYNDDRYKQEIRYMYDEFEAIRKDTWANIKSKSVDYRNRIIEQYLKANAPTCAAWVKDRIKDLQKHLIDMADAEQNDHEKNVINHRIGDLHMAIQVINKYADYFGEIGSGRNESILSVFVPCAEDDPRVCGGYTSNDGQALCYVREVNLSTISKESDAVEFAEWTGVKYYWRPIAKEWGMYDNHDFKATTEQLYQLYQQSK
jgi:hypothetical protein